MLLVLAIVAAAIGAAFVVSLRWIRRFVRRRRARRLTPEQRSLEASLRLPTARQLYVERLLFALGVILLLCLGWGLFVEPNRIEDTEHHIVSPKLRPDARLRIVQLSDMHAEARATIEPAVVARVAELKPDLIVFTGDAVNVQAGLPVFRRTLSSLAQIAPTYGVYGNWETWWFPNLDLYGNTGAHLLKERAEAVTIRGQTLWLVGVGVDRESLLPRAMARVPKGSLSVLLHHFPALAPRASKLGIDVMLAGDTHGGQARLPGLGELVRLRRRGFWRSSGMHREGSMWLYVNRGLGGEGGLPRFRFNCRPEVSLIVIEGHD